MAKQNKTRSKVEENMFKEAVTSNAIDLITLKRMYPKRFLADIMKEEGYMKAGNKYVKQSDE